MGRLYSDDLTRMAIDNSNRSADRLFEAQKLRYDRDRQGRLDAMETEKFGMLKDKFGLEKRKLASDTALSESQANLFNQYSQKFGQQNQPQSQDTSEIDRQIAELKAMLGEPNQNRIAAQVSAPNEQDPMGLGIF